MKQLYAELAVARDAIIVAHAFRRRVMNDIAKKRAPLEIGAIYEWLGHPHHGRHMRCDEIGAVGGWVGSHVDGRNIDWCAYLTLLKADGTPMTQGKFFRRWLINTGNVKKLKRVRRGK